jgi:short-subunit dehydrogenase
MASGLAVVTGASSGIGYELAKCCAENGYDLIVCADDPRMTQMTHDFGDGAIHVEALVADLGTKDGIDKLWAAIGGRPVDLLLANAGRGLGHAFLDQDFEEAKDVVDVNITGTISLIHKVGRQMRERNQGRILITGSIAGFMPGSFQAVYNGTKAFLDSFSLALRNELKDTEVTVTCLMPGPTDTDFFETADLMDTSVGQGKKADPAKVAKDGYKAMMDGKPGVVSGFMNKVEAAFSGVIPDTMLAQMHRHMAEPQTRH